VFGPNQTPHFHHRCDTFKTFYARAQAAFRKAFDISPDFEVVFLLGGGTVAAETILRSVSCAVQFEDYHRDFCGRALRIYTGMLPQIATRPLRNCANFYVQYETGDSEFNVCPERDGTGPIICDAVSSFPYYEIPDDVDIWFTVSGKQIGAEPGLSIVVVRKTLIHDSDILLKGGYSTMSLDTHLLCARGNEVLNTPAFCLLESLMQACESFDGKYEHRMRIDARRMMLEDTFSGDALKGDGPVVTVYLGAISEALIEKYDLYRHHGNVQLFLWTGDSPWYKQFCDEVTREQSTLPA